MPAGGPRIAVSVIVEPLYPGTRPVFSGGQFVIFFLFFAVEAQLGLYIMPISFGIKATGLVDEKGDAKFTAPLPTVGFRMDVALAPKWFFRSGTQIFYLEYQQFKGSILAAQGAV